MVRRHAANRVIFGREQWCPRALSPKCNILCSFTFKRFFIAIFFTSDLLKFLHTFTFDNICVTYYKLLSLLQDISFTAARSKFISIQAGRRTLAEKLNIYLGILKNFKPVFHHFFTEHYLDPVTWYERRLAYTKR